MLTWRLVRDYAQTRAIKAGTAHRPHHQIQVRHCPHCRLVCMSAGVAVLAWRQVAMSQCEQFRDAENAQACAPVAACICATDTPLQHVPWQYVRQSTQCAHMIMVIQHQQTALCCTLVNSRGVEFFINVITVVD